MWTKVAGFETRYRSISGVLATQAVVGSGRFGVVAIAGQTPGGPGLRGGEDMVVRNTGTAAVVRAVFDEGEVLADERYESVLVLVLNDFG